MSIIRWLTAIVVIILSVTSLFAYKGKLNAAQAGQSGGEPAATVQSTTVKSTVFQQTTTVNGEVQAIQVMELSNELAGKIATLSFKSGDLVHQGQVLIALDHSEEHARLIAAKGNVELYRKTLKRYEQLHQQSKMSEESVDQALANLRSAESQVALFQSFIDKKTIKAPFTARAGIHNLQLGQYLEQNMSLTQLIGTSDTIWVDFSVPQFYQQLALGETVSVLSNGAANQAQVISVEPMLSSQSRHLKYRALIDNRHGTFKHNQLVKITLPVGEQQTRLTVPDMAVNKSHLGSFVYLLKQDEQGNYRAHKHNVTLGERVKEMVIINDGLAVGQMIADKGTFKLRPGLKVFLADSTVVAEATHEKHE